MRLAISNIAWPAGQDEIVAPILIDRGVEGVEIAPTKVWPKPLEATPAEVASYRESWERRGLRIVALQALLFGRPDLTLFDGPAPRRQAIDYLKGMIGLATLLGAEALVFGSPKNRRVGTRPRGEAEEIAVAAFGELGEYASRNRVAFCIEPNPTAYDCDFVTTAGEGAALVERVAQEGFGLHLDTGAMTLAGDDYASIFARAAGSWRHFHVSEPNLAPVGSDGVPHRAIAAAAHAAGYGGWTSIEMKEVGADRQPWMEAVGDSIRYVGDVYR